VFGIGLVVVLHYGVLGAMLASFFSSSIVVLFSFLYFTRKVYEYRFNRDMFKKMLKFGFPLIWAELAAWVDNSSDRFFLLHYSTLKEIGYYSIGTTFSQPILLLNMAVQMSFGVLFYKTYNEEKDIEKKESKKLASDSFNLYLVAGVTIAAFLSLFSEDLVRFITTAKYVKGAAAVPFLTFSYVAAQAYQVMGPGITLAEKTWYYTWLTIGSALLNILLNFIFIPKWGFVGAAASTLVSFVAYWLVKLKISLKFFYIPYRFKSIFSYYFISLAISLFFPLKFLYDGYKAPFSIKFVFILFILVLPFFLKLIELADIKKLYKKIAGIIPVRKTR
jgi:O-antigen/teichoic acid export membrane protein